MNGVLILDKPARLTSHDVVNRVRRILGQRSVGHLGTLDPAATGVLPVVFGNLTRLAQFYSHSEKTYEGAIRFGFATDTYDADGEPTTPPPEENKLVPIDVCELRALALQFQGIIRQMPPPFSAKKIGGVPAYKLARKKQEVVLQPVLVEIKEFEILSAAGDQATFRARVASGTYIRSVAHDMGQRLGCGAHLASLRRTAVAEFAIGDAHTLAELEAAMQQGTVDALFVHPRKLVPQLPSVTASEESAALIRSGRATNLPEMSKAPQIKVFYGQRDLIAIATRVAGTLFHPRVVFTGSAD
ncbi:MAG: tRNA pseudouridine(55) synthase TruB [Terriglobales bacterium]|jgi:tRNA pseudouridine55 synthase